MEDETVRAGLIQLGHTVVNIALWESELIAQGVTSLPTPAEIKSAAIEFKGRSSTPNVITMRQCHLCLHRRGLLPEVDARIQGLPTEARIEWEHSSEVSIDSPLVAAIAGLFDYDDADIRGFFVEAVAI